MGDSLIAIVAIFLAAILMFIFPLMSLSQTNDEVGQLAVQVLTEELVSEIRTSGKLTQHRYDTFIQQLYATGNSYEIEIERKVLDENIARTKEGQNNFYSVYTSSIKDVLNKNNEYIFYEGDIITITVKNNSRTLAQLLSNLFYKIVGDGVSAIATTVSGTVTTNGGNGLSSI